MPAAFAHSPSQDAPPPLARRDIAFFLLLDAGALLLRTWNLAQTGWGNEYYTAATRSMAANWHNFFFAAFDPAGFISVDKPPLALWIDALSVRVFGFHPASVLLPHALMGAAAVCVLAAMLRPRYGTPTALLAGAFYALTPISVAADRSNLTDSLLVLVLLCAAWALLAATERASRRWLVLAFALVGVAFNVKMLAAYVVVPAFVAVFLLSARTTLRRRAADVALAGTVALAVSAPWLLVVESTPPGDRPYVGSSRSNSVLDLVLGYNGLGRFVARAPGVDPLNVSSDSARRIEVPVETKPRSIERARASAPPAGDDRARLRAARLFVRTPAGPLRLVEGQLAAQALWLLPLALAGIVGGLRRQKNATSGRARTATLLWCAWLLVYGVVYSFAGGIFHFYYLSTLAPAVAALAALGATVAWRACRERDWRRFVVPATWVLTGAWQAFIQSRAIGMDLPVPEWMQQIAWAGVAGGAAAGALMLVANRFSANAHLRHVRVAAVCFGVTALLVLPAVWVASSVVVPADGTIPSADLLRLDGTAPATNAGRERFIAHLAPFLEANHHGERFVLATSTYQLAAAIIIGTGAPVLARGGFHGFDPALTPESLARRVEAGEVRFATVGDVSAVSRRFGPAQVDVVAWIRAHGTPVDPALWRGPASRAIELYDLRGAPPVAAAPRATSSR